MEDRPRRRSLRLTARLHRHDHRDPSGEEDGVMIISCPKCGRRLIVKSRQFGRLLGCPSCQARFAASSLPRRKRPSGWQNFLSGFILPFCIVANFAKKCWTGLTSAAKAESTASHLRHSPHVNGRMGSERFFEHDEYDDDDQFNSHDISQLIC